MRKNFRLTTGDIARLGEVKTSMGARTETEVIRRLLKEWPYSPLVPGKMVFNSLSDKETEEPFEDIKIIPDRQ